MRTADHPLLLSLLLPLGRGIGLLLLLGLAPAVGPAAWAQTVTLRGFIVDGSDGEPLPGANVLVRGVEAAGQARGAVSDKDGYYQVGGIPPGRYVMRVSFVGYRAFVDTLDLGAAPFVTQGVALQPAEALLGEVVVDAEGGAATVEAGQQTIRPSDLERIPTPDISGDLASYLQSLPGVVAVGDRGGQLFIRGGTPAQNLVLMDGALLYQPFHIIGFFSAFPEDLVSNVDMYAGGFGARYSGRISSVIDVTTREGNKQQFDASASLSPFLAGVQAEGPLRRGTLSFLSSVRTSTVEQLGSAVLGQTLPYRFGDVFLKLHRTDRDNSRCSVTALHTYDRGRIDPDAGARGDLFRWRNRMVGGRCLVFPARSPMLADINTSISNVTNEVGGAERPERSSNATQVASEFNLTYYAGPVEVHWGFFARANWFGYRLGEQFTNLREDDDLLISSGAYVDGLWRFGGRLEVQPGLVVTLYPFMFNPSIEPRFRMAWRPRGAETTPVVSAAAGLYRQTLLGISDERDAGSVFIAWMPAPVGGAQAQAVHALAGVQQQVGPLRLALEGYYKRLNDLPVPIWSTMARFTTALTLARGDVYGFDTRVEFQRRPLYLYLGYGYAWTAYEAGQDNFGVWFGDPIQRYHPPHDRRHQVNAIASLDLGAFDASVRWQFGSGLPFTRPMGFDELIPLVGLRDVRTFYGISRVLYDKPYRGRLPTYHRLDVSAERAFTLGGSRLTLQAGAINVYNRANLFYFDVFTVRRVDQLPLLPYVALKLETR